MFCYWPHVQLGLDFVRWDTCIAAHPACSQAPINKTLPPARETNKIPASPPSVPQGNRRGAGVCFIGLSGPGGGGSLCWLS
jgi:hypothetical protein